MICPASGWLHAPRGVLVYASSRAKVPMVTCSCGTRVFLGSRWDPAYHGYTKAELSDMSVTTEGPVEERRQPGRGARYVICPSSRFVHGGIHAVPIRFKTKHHCHCFGCSVTIFMGPRWSPEHGYTMAQVRDMGATVDG